MTRVIFYLGAVAFWVGILKVLLPTAAFPLFTTCTHAANDLIVCGPGPWALAVPLTGLGAALVAASIGWERWRAARSRHEAGPPGL